LNLDDFDIHPLDTASVTAFVEIFKDRHTKRVPIIIRQLPIKQFYEVISETCIADAKLDRVLNNAQSIKLKRESLRRKQKKETTIN
jgi:DNA replication protein DnaC